MLIQMLNVVIRRRKKKYALTTCKKKVFVFPKASTRKHLLSIFLLVLFVTSAEVLHVYIYRVSLIICKST